MIIRLNYPAESRGWVTGRLRRWSVGTFLLAGLATARVLDRAGTWPVIQAGLVTAAALQALAHLVFSRIRVRPEPRGEADADGFARGGWSSLVGAVAAVGGDRRFLRYLWGSVIFQLGNLLYEPIVRAFLSSELHFNYTQCVFIADVLPSAFSLVTTHRLGAWLDRTNPLIAWSRIRLGCRASTRCCWPCLADLAGGPEMAIAAT